LLDDAVHPGDLGRDRCAHPPYDELGGCRWPWRCGATAGAAPCGGSSEHDSRADRGCWSGEVHCPISLPGSACRGVTSSGRTPPARARSLAAGTLRWWLAGRGVWGTAPVGPAGARHV